MIRAAVLAAIALVAAGCSVDRRSGRLECERTADCDPGRICNEGLCVSSSDGDASIREDARTDAPPDASVCPAACTSCTDETCTIDCAAPGANCGQPIACPAGWNCAVRCSEQFPCSVGVDCGLARSCDIDCDGADSCRDIACGDGRCTVDCSGNDACRRVDCSTSCSCDVTCKGTFSCRGVECRSPLACGDGFGCTSQRPGCNECL